MKENIPYASQDGIDVMAPIYISIDAEYFRPKFQKILDRRDWWFGCDTADMGYLLNELIECLKNPEGK